MALLHQLSPNQLRHTGDVIFVHGLDGDAFETWSFRAAESWATWLAASRPDLRIWTVSYDAASSAWRGSAMPLADRAVNVLAALYGSGLGEKPICFVTHSMGGLVIKQVLREASSTSTEYRGIVKSIKGLVFLATPHTGSDVASLATYLQTLLRLTEAAEELEAHAPALRDLNRWFRNNVVTLGLKVKVFFETRPFRGVFVVNASSADPGLENVTPVPVDADHVSICKPSGPTDVVYSTTFRFIDEVLPAATLADADPLGTIQRNVLAARGVQDLEVQQAELKVFLMHNPSTTQALMLQKRIETALVRTEHRALPSARYELLAPSPWRWLVALLAVGLGLAGVWKLFQWLF